MLSYLSFIFNISYFGNVIKHRTVCFSEKCLKWASCLTWQFPFSSPEPFVSWSRGLKQIKPSGSRDENEQFHIGSFGLKRVSVLSRIVLGLSSPLEIPCVAPQEKFSFWPHNKSFISRRLVRYSCLNIRVILFLVARLFTVPNFSVRPSRSGTFCHGPPSWFPICTERAATKTRWRLVTNSARSRRSYGKIGDCEKSIFLAFIDLHLTSSTVHKNAN